MFFLVTAISLGFLGSFHCVGMCGPIALAIPLINQSAFSKLISGLLYNFGRVFTYFVLGIFFGLVGSSFAIFGLQQVLSVLMGIIILLSVVLPKKIITRYTLTAKFYQTFSGLKSKLSILFGKKMFSSLFAIGILNGLLPCGLVYIAIAGALATCSPIKGAAFMAVFGLGTIPAMFSISWFSNLITVKFRSGINKAMPYVISVMAVIMILRGMNLGIPYLSPELQKDKKTISCCEKKQTEDQSGKPIIKCCQKK